MSERTEPPPPHVSRYVSVPAATITTAAAVSVVRLRLCMGKSVGGGGGLRRNLTLFDFEEGEITLIDCSSLKYLASAVLIPSHNMRTRKQFEQSDRRMTHVQTEMLVELRRKLKKVP